MGNDGGIHNLNEASEIRLVESVFPLLGKLARIVGVTAVIIVGNGYCKEKRVGRKLLKYIHLTSCFKKLFVGNGLIPYVVAYHVLLILKSIYNALCNVTGYLVFKISVLHTSHDGKVLENNIYSVLFASVNSRPSLVVRSPAHFKHIESCFLTVLGRSVYYFKKSVTLFVRLSKIAERRKSIFLLFPVKSLVSNRITVVSNLFHTRNLHLYFFMSVSCAKYTLWSITKGNVGVFLK